MLGVTADAVASACAELGELAERDVPLGALTTYRVGGPAAIVVRPVTRDDLTRIAAAVDASGLPLLLVGRGSNMLVSDRGFGGIAVLSGELPGGIEIDHTTAQVSAGGGVLLPVLARHTAREGLTGFEWAVGVPGSVGGAVRMNAGGHGSDIAASLIDALVADLSGTDPAAVTRVVPATELGLGFRSSLLRPDELVLSARLQLAAGARARAEGMISEIVKWRREHQPGGQNAGSVFVNPVPGEVSAGALIDGLGLRGFRHRSAVVSEKHANFIQADDSGSADDVYELMRIVRARVEAETGYALRTEIRLIGFEDRRDD